MFSCQKCGGLKAKKQSRCGEPCFKNATLSTLLQSNIIQVKEGKKEQLENNTRQNTIESNTRQNTDEKEEQNTRMRIPCSEKEVLEKSFDDPIFQMYPGKYMDAMEYLIIHFWKKDVTFF